MAQTVKSMPLTEQVDLGLDVATKIQEIESVVKRLIAETRNITVDEELENLTKTFEGLRLNDHQLPQLSSIPDQIKQHFKDCVRDVDGVKQHMNGLLNQILMAQRRGDTMEEDMQDTLRRRSFQFLNNLQKLKETYIEVITGLYKAQEIEIEKRTRGKN